MLRPGLLFIPLWAAFAISWFAAAAWSAKTERRVGVKGELGYRIVLVAGGLAQFDPGAYDAYRGRVPMLLPFGPR